MFKILKSVIPPLISLVILVLGSGFFLTYITLRLRMEGYGTEIAGFVTGGYYAGLFTGSFLSEKFISRLGLIRSYAIFASLTAVLCMVQGVFIHPWLWVGLRILGGFCMAALFIVIESWLLMRSTQQTRGKVLSIYMIVFYGALALAQLILNASDPKSYTPFAITGILCILSILPIAIINKTVPRNIEPSVLNIVQLCKAAPLGFIGCIISGGILGSVFGLAPSYAKEIRMDMAHISLFMSITIFGGLLLQWPLGHFSDRWERRKVLCAACLATVVLSIVIAGLDNSFPLTLLIIALIFGGFSFTLYPLSLSYTCDFIPPKDYIAASGALQIAYGMGAIIGPITAPLSMKAFGPAGLYIFFAVTAGILGFLSLLRIWKKPTKHAKEEYIFCNLPNTPLILSEKKENHS